MRTVKASQSIAARTSLDVSAIEAMSIPDIGPPPSADRRSESRLQTVLRVGRVIGADDEGLVRVRNISDEGAQLRLSLPLQPADKLMLELGDDLFFAGHVVWRSGDDCGIKFDHPIDCVAVLAQLATGTQIGAGRPVRLPVTSTALTSGEHGRRPVRVTDISQRGLKVIHDGSLKAGLYLTVTLPGGLDRYGIVRWTRENIAGVMFLQPLSVELLGSARHFSREVRPVVACAVKGLLRP